MKMTDRAYRRDTRRLPKWKELVLAKDEHKSQLMKSHEHNLKDKKVVK
jgi:predicted protein tyrosine phosphatase